MNIIIPINSKYLVQRYHMKDSLLNELRTHVVPAILTRLSFDHRVTTVEVISNINFAEDVVLSNKVRFNKFDVGPTDDQYEVIAHLLEQRSVSSDLVVQLNPLFPFVSVSSLFRAYKSVEDNCVNSAIGSFVNKVAVHSPEIGSEYDMGVFSVYRESIFAKNKRRLSFPLDVIGLKAAELICLRNTKDLELYELLLNAGFEI